MIFFTQVRKIEFWKNLLKKLKNFQISITKVKFLKSIIKKINLQILVLAGHFVKACLNRKINAYFRRKLSIIYFSKQKLKDHFCAAQNNLEK